MSNMPEDLKTAAEAKILRCGFSIGYFDKSVIERWAERQIAAYDEPSIELIDLAILRNTHPIDVMNPLTKVGQDLPDSESAAAQFGFIGLQFESGDLPLFNTVRWLFSLKDQPEISESERLMLYWLDDAYDLALTGIDSLENVDSQLREFIAPYVVQVKSIIDALELPERRTD
jgi:hypothetical protein